MSFTCELPARSENADGDIFYIVKAPKKSLSVLRFVVLVFIMVCGVSICSITLKQNITSLSSPMLNIKVFDQRKCQPPVVQHSELPHLHYPNPKTFSREECECNPVRFFVILSMQRSGSGWFETLLNSHINVSSNGEIFSVKERRINSSTITQVMDKVFNLDWLTSASKNHCSAAVGFKWMLNQGLMEHHKDIADYFEKKSVSIIFLFRKNLLRRMISIMANSYDKDAKSLNGTHKSHVHSLEEAETLARYKPNINATLLIHELKQAEDKTAMALQYYNMTRHIVLYYEDLITNNTKLRDVEEFLKLPHRELTSQQVKIHRGPISDNIGNFVDVQNVLTGTSYEPFLR